MNLFKKYFLIIFILSIVSGQSNIISISDTVVVGGDTAWVSVNVTNTDDIAGIQFDLSYPDEFTYSDSILAGDRFVDHELQVEFLDPMLRVMVYSTSLTPITGNSGTVLTLGFATEPVLGEFEIEFVNPVLANTDYENVLTGFDNGIISVLSPKPRLSPFNLITIPEDSSFIIEKDSLYSHVVDVNTPNEDLIWNFYSEYLIVLQQDTNYLVSSPPNWNGIDTILVFVDDGTYSDTTYIPFVVTPVNDPPTPPNLISPINGWTADFVLITFEWSTPTDVEDDSLNMMLYFNSLNNLDSLSIAENDTTITIYQFNFPINEPIQWWIEVSDGEFTTVSDSFTFTIPDGLYHDGPTWHVATTGSDSTGDGSVGTPFASIQHGIDIASSGDTVLVAAGTYTENINYNGKNIVVGSLYLTTQDTSYISTTIIDGNQNGSVVTIDESATLIGFKIKNGYDVDSNGGGIDIQSTGTDVVRIENCFISNNTAIWGAGIYMGNSNGLLKSNKIENNYATHGGGGLFLWNGDVSIINCNINANETLYNDAGGIFIGNNSNVNITKCLITNNDALDNGSGTCGGVTSQNSNVNIVNSVLYNNIANNSERGSAIESFSSSFSIINSIVWGNSNTQIYGSPTISYSIVQNGFSGTGNIDSDPLFTNVSNNDFSLQSSSPAIDAGDPDLDGDGTTWETDTDDQDPDGTRMDMGAYYFDQSSILLTPPQNLTATPGNEQVTLTWAPNSEPDLHKYNIYRDTSSPAVTLIDSIKRIQK